MHMYKNKKKTNEKATKLEVDQIKPILFFIVVSILGYIAR